MKRKKLFMLPCIAAVTIATFVGTKTIKSVEGDNNALLMANVEALSSNGDCDVVLVRDCQQKMSGEQRWGEKHDIIYCGDCESHAVTKSWDGSTCRKQK